MLERSDGSGLEINNAENEDVDDIEILVDNTHDNQNNSAVNKNTLLDSARVAVMSIVKIAADVLDIRQKDTCNLSNCTSNDTASNHTEEMKLSKCITPGYIMICHGCNDTFYKQ